VYLFSNVVVGLLALSLGVLALRIRGHRLWRNAFAELWKRRPIALVVVALYVTIALLGAVSWVGGVSSSEAAGASDLVALQEPRSVIDRMFPLDFKEDGYSSPFAKRLFYEDRELRFPGRHPLGTDINGRDVLLLTLRGSRIALLVGGFTSLIVIPLALLFGVSAGYFGRRVDDVVFYIMSVLASIPSILLLISIIAVLGKGTWQVCVALGVTSWVGFCRISRGESFKLRELDYVRAARALGCSESKIIFRHILPNLVHLILITFVLLFSDLVLAEATLSFLGIGIDGSWGQMIDLARDELARQPAIGWNFFAAFAALFGLILPVNMLGDALRDVLDPRTLGENR